MLDHGLHLSRSNRYVVAAVRIWGNGQEYFERAETRNLFAIAADMAFRHCDANVNMHELIGLFNCAVQAVKLCRRGKWWNGGCYCELPWLATLVQVLERNDIPYFPFSGLSPLLNELEENRSLGLLPGATIEDDLATLRGLCEKGSKLRTSLKTLPGSSQMASDPPVQPFDVDEVIKRIKENSMPTPKPEEGRPSPAHSRSSTLYDASDARKSSYPGASTLSKNVLQELAATPDLTEQDPLRVLNGLARTGSPDVVLDVQLAAPTVLVDTPPPLVTSDSDVDQQPFDDLRPGTTEQPLESVQVAETMHSVDARLTLPVPSPVSRPPSIPEPPLFMPEPIVAVPEPPGSIPLVNTDLLSMAPDPSPPRTRSRSRSFGDFTLHMPHFGGSVGHTDPPDPGTSSFARGSMVRNRQRLSMLSRVSIPEEPEGLVLPAPENVEDHSHG